MQGYWNLLSHVGSIPSLEIWDLAENEWKNSTIWSSSGFLESVHVSELKITIIKTVLFQIEKFDTDLNMGRACAVAVCKSTTGLTVHRFPSDPQLRKAWIVACRRKDPFDPDKMRICESHFLPTDYERDLRNELLNLPLRKLLKPESIPTQNLLPSPEVMYKVRLFFVF